jgi:outer membrane lipoprotein SlyB
MRKIFITVIILLFAGCASQSPVLYPNAYLKSVGEAQAQNDIEECSHLADAYVKANPGAKVIGGVIVGGAGGAIVGGAVGAVTGNIGRGAAVGGVAGATSGLIHGIYRASKPSLVYKAFVNHCLRDKGYEPLGWE